MARLFRYRAITSFFDLNPSLNVHVVPLPTIEAVRTAVAGSTFFSVLDLREGFYQFDLDEASRSYTAFGALGTRLYQYKVLPMGCSISTTMMQHIITGIMGVLYFRNVIVYCDDLLVYSQGDEM